MPLDVTIIGAGAAGFFAALAAAERGRTVLLLEKNNKTGVKILMSGGTRCNVTQNTNAAGIVEGFGKNGKFLHSALSHLSPVDVVDWFRTHGVETKVEPNGKVFPVSDRALDVRNALLDRAVQHQNITLRTGAAVTEIARSKSGFSVVSERETWKSSAVIIATGGKSYPDCGTVGEGYQWAESFGHSIVEPIPALTPIVSPEAWVKQLQGITLPDVKLGIFAADVVGRISEKNFQKLAVGYRRNAILFTHFGISGPAALDVSKHIASRPGTPLRLGIDFLPNLTRDELHAEFLNAENRRKLPKTVLLKWLPLKLVEGLIEQSGIESEANLSEQRKNSVLQLLDRLKKCDIPIEGTRGFKKAEVTAGGVALKEVNSQTMESKLCEGLYFAGEVLDLDGPIGGFNFQSAFSTGYLAGMNA